MAFLAAIKSHDKTTLNGSETIEKDRAGNMYRVWFDDEGTECREWVGKGGEYVVDNTPDPVSFRVVDGLFVGSQDAAASREHLDEAGITHILNVASGIKESFPGDYVYRAVEMMDTPDFGIESHITECLEFIDAAMADNGRVLVHCNAGVSRSATVVLAWMMTRQPEEFPDFDTAFAHAKASREKIRPNPGFENYLRSLDGRGKGVVAAEATAESA